MFFKFLSLIPIFIFINLGFPTAAPEPWLKWVKQLKGSYQGPYGTPAIAHFTYLNRDNQQAYIDLQKRPLRFQRSCKGCALVITKEKAGGLVRFKGKSLPLQLNVPMDLPGEDALSLRLSEQREGLRLSVFDRSQPKLKLKRQRHFFNYDTKAVVKASWSPYATPKTIKMPRSNQTQLDMLAYGELKWTGHGGELQSLTLYDYAEDSKSFQESRKHMLIFRDLTNGRSTYGAGRFVMIEATRPFLAWKPGETVPIDLNYSYNPPCSVSNGFQCPLPQDLINEEIHAGEKYNKI